MSKIVVISLFKNEEVFLKQALHNIVEFADEIILIDNESVDASQKIAIKFGSENDHVQYIIEPNAHDTNKYLEEYVGTDTWVLGVDGDELYNPQQLNELRDLIEAGTFADNNRIIGHTINPLFKSKNSSAFMCTQSPEARSIVKLYNFQHITKVPKGERLHGEYEWSHQNTLDLTKEPIEKSILTCCHMCFFRRSPLDTEVPRSAPEGHGGPMYKVANYKRGSLHEHDLSYYGINYASEHLD